MKIKNIGTNGVFRRALTRAQLDRADATEAHLTDPSPAITGPAAAAVTLRAALPDLTALTPAERTLLGDWLDRIAG